MKYYNKIEDRLLTKRELTCIPGFHNQHFFVIGKNIFNLCMPNIPNIMVLLIIIRLQKYYGKIIIVNYKIFNHIYQRNQLLFLTVIVACQTTVHLASSIFLSMSKINKTENYLITHIHMNACVHTDVCASTHKCTHTRTQTHTQNYKSLQHEERTLYWCHPLKESCSFR